jgi:N-methylhydantoinase A/oxoprolinase/acetone carboxylase beta subunit
VEIVNLRLHAVGKTEPIPFTTHPHAGPDPQPAFLGRRPVFLSGASSQMIPIYRGEALLPGNQLVGPALVVRRDTTILLGENDTGWVDLFLNLLINVSGATDARDRLIRDYQHGRAALPGEKYI